MESCNSWISSCWRIGSPFIVLMSSCSGAELAARSGSRPQAIFAFGSSLTDPGNAQAAFPYQSFPQSKLPCGETSFHRPANRYSNGRVVVDFFAQALKIPLLSPHLQSIGHDFSHGADFAFSGVMTQNNTYPFTVSPPFNFWVQTNQFQYFKERTLALWKSSPHQGRLKSSLKHSTNPKYFQSGLYMITFCTDDFVVPLIKLNHTIEEVQSNISVISDAMVANTEVVWLSQLLLVEYSNPSVIE